jgi:rhodanese-related sulfurtransferase/rubrerythrin
MSMLDYFKPVSSWTAERLRDFLDHHGPDDYTLLDVRQPREYEEGHLPGARLLPAGELEAGRGELDPGRPTIVYCTAGVRSHAAAAALQHAGFAEVYHLAGGIRAWRGEVAEGSPQVVLDLFAAVSRPGEHVALAWWLEEGTRRFYAGIAEVVRDAAAAGLFRELVGAEERHKATLRALFEGVTGRPAAADFPRGVLLEVPAEALMEGGMRVEEALEWCRRRPVGAILELAVALETSAYDHYLLLGRELENADARRAFEVLADEERRHLRRLTAQLDHFV